MLLGSISVRSTSDDHEQCIVHRLRIRQSNQAAKHCRQFVLSRYFKAAHLIAGQVQHYGLVIRGNDGILLELKKSDGRMRLLTEWTDALRFADTKAQALLRPVSGLCPECDRRGQPSARHQEGWNGSGTNYTAT